MRVVVGSATFFDAFDALVIAFVLPVLIPLWQMSPAQVGLLVASGHYRNGILLAPITAEAVAALLAGDEPPAETAAFDPRRFEV